MNNENNIPEIGDEDVVDLHIAPSFKRFLNYIIDSFVISFIASFVFGFVSIEQPKSVFEIHDLKPTLILLLISFVYYFISESLTGKTIGKVITRTMVVNEYGEKPTVWEITKRSICRFIPLEFISFLFKHIGWHDSLSNTMVIETTNIKSK